MAAAPVARFLIVAALAAVSVSAHASPVDVQHDRVVLHGDFIPRFTDLPRVLVVPAGQTVTLPPDSTWDAIEVAGTLRVSRTYDTVCRFIHLTILPGGTLDAGTVQDPVLRRVELIVRDVPIDTTRDPYQWGNGLINLGHQSRVGRRVARAWTELAADAEAGATTIQLDVPEGWQVGDELFLPDLRQIRDRTAPVRRESTVTIAAIVGDTIRLSKPLDFEHRSILDPDGAVVVRPRVANLTRNIVVRSENPAGTRGHTANIGPATWDIRYNALIDLGRTRAENLDSTTADPSGTIVHIGTNQIARYASHDHHVDSLGGRLIGNVLLETAGIGKWGHSTHGTHDTRIEENIALGFMGAGFVTEDGYEVRNVFRNNVAALSKGNGISAIGNVDTARGRNCPGCEGAGFWFRGVVQTIEGNEAWNNRIGVNLFHMDVVADRLIPGVPGAEPDTPFDPRDSAPVSMADNVTVSNVESGLEQWGTPRFPVVRAVSAYNGQKQAFAGVSDFIHMWLQDPTLVASGGLTDGVSTSAAYVASLEVDGGRIVGCRNAFQRGGARQFFRLRNITLQCATNINFVSGDYADESTYDNVLHKPLGSFAKRYLVIGNGNIWQPGDPVFPSWTRDVLPSTGSRHLVKNWQGTGQDFRLYETQQLASAPALPATGAPGTNFYCPDDGATMGECWDRYGLGYQGGVVPDEEALTLDGLINGVGRHGLTTTLGVPRAVLTTPNMMAPATVQVTPTGGRIMLNLALTGKPEQANDRVAIVQIDDRPPARLVRGQGQHPSEVSAWTYVASEGTHTVRTWREDLAGARIPESELVFRYFVSGSSTEDPEPDPTPPPGGGTPPPTDADLPSGFAESPVADGLDSPSAIELAPDGRLFVAEQAGVIRVIRQGQLLSTPLVALNVQAEGERGLLDLALDPAFPSNGFVYVYYTTAGPDVRMRVSRFAAAGDVADPASEQVLLELTPPDLATGPTGGTLAFDPAGRLFVGVAGDSSAASSPGGTLLRINPDGSVPADNPGTPAGRIWATGLRHPVAVSFHEQTGTMLIGNDLANGWSEILEGQAGADYGGSHALRQYTYEHGGLPECRLTSGTFYEPGLALFPAEYHDAYFFADSCTGTIRRLDLWDGQVVAFATGVASVRDLEVSADGALYYLVRNPDGSGGRVLRVDYAQQPGDPGDPGGGTTDPPQETPPTDPGTGLSGAYFDGLNFTAPAATRVDATVDFSWGGGAPVAGMGVDTFSVRWTGKVVPQYGETYTFYTQSDDGTRLWVNGQLLIDDWTAHPTLERSGAITLQAGQQYDIRLEYFENGGGASVRLLWSSASTPKALVPQSRLYPSASSPPPPPPPPSDEGTGLAAAYFDAMNFTAPVATRVDPTIAFNWGIGAPLPGMGADTFSIRWTGKVKPLASETYTFYTVSDDGVRLWVNGRLLIDDWTAHAPREGSGSIALQAGQLYDIRMEYFESGGGAVASLSWSSPSTPKAIVPKSQLFAGTTAATTATTEP